ncbi:uncharacterized protein TRIVIDRAFT_60434 [Trichoderma virens Gv29-8]|uniref:Uncharacterized protein n=1 Tax=Hypocrea virens (strain Gv29-8 / FGSC 10586) TaxID=413071 RepID=G9MRK6_HYPVG|nr:uncharacterized protein TRIVIDRAFT_60434 [Trichoderma virens Gv29-8]EHK22727.1 hypothetical protein TRIVIDRAFT_60434 [Trichoderma virens Gv29-8]UKZ47778.1 hypothetical protein TrVGV298_002007 [Trichoderma virens]
MNRSVSILSNLSEMSESFVFGTTRWYPDEPKTNHDYSSDLREPKSKTSDTDIDDDWSDMPTYNPKPSARASGSDMERERPERRRSIKADVDHGAGSSSSASTGSRPIAIPRSRQNSSASAITLPEALSARGEKQGGYFPLHEDPKTRVRHTHPFYHDIKSHIMDHSVEDVDTGADADIDMPMPRSQYHLSGSARDHNEPYWLPSDDDEDSEPFRSASMGKYYPGVYERRQAQKKSGRPVEPAPSNRPPASQSRTPRTQRNRPKPKTPVLAPRSAAATEAIPPLKLSSAE